MKFTRTEAEILLHRIDLPDAVADVFQGRFPRGNILSAIRMLKRFLTEGEDVLDAKDLPELQRELMIECAEGSTFLCGVEDAVATGEISRGKALAWERAAQSIEKKLSLPQRQVLIPRQ